MPSSYLPQAAMSTRYGYPSGVTVLSDAGHGRRRVPRLRMAHSPPAVVVSRSPELLPDSAPTVSRSVECESAEATDAHPPSWC